MKFFKSPLKKLTLGIYDGPHATPNDTNSGHIFLGIKNITPQGRLDFSEVNYISDQEFPQWTKRVIPQKDDIVFTYEATLHRYAIIPDRFDGCLGRRIGLVRPDTSKVIPRFLHYYFLSSIWRHYTETKIIVGATVKRLPVKDFPEFIVSIPESLKVQQKIADILSSYDDLIENNRRRIQLLEESARLLYKEWFVRLRFPGHEHVKVVDGVPEGWERKTLGDICINVHSAVDPMKVSANTPYIGLEHMPRRSISLGEWGIAEAVTSMKLAFQTGDILFGKIRSYFHKVGITFVDGITSSDAVVLSPSDEKFRMYVLTIVSSDEFVNISAKTAKQGSKMPRADWNYLMTFPILLPKDSLLESYNENIYSIVDQLKALSLMNRKLAQARDLLLPKLMSGEVAV